MAPAKEGLQVAGLSHAYRRPNLSDMTVLRDLDFQAQSGEIVAVTGASGSGKSTLLHVLGGMLRPTAGSIRLDGVEPWTLSNRARAAWRNSQVGFVFQTHHLLGELSALENVLVPGWLRGGNSDGMEDAARELLERLGLAARLHHLPRELSGGEAQRVAVARALVQAPRLVLADEPTGNLDKESGECVFDEFVTLQKERGFTALVATHSAELAGRCDRVLHVAEGGLAESVLSVATE